MSTSAHSLINGFKQLIADGALGHAYLFFGESRQATGALPRGILELLEPASGNAPLIDGRELRADESGSIGIDAVRSAILFLWQKPLRAPRKTLFIDGADALTAEAQHALLKTVEEPPEHGLILASVLDAQALVAPLVSRFQKIYVAGDETAPLAGAEKEAAALAKKFIAGSAAERKSIIGKVLEAEELPPPARTLAHFIRHLLMECHKDPVRHVCLMARITDRWAKMREFNTNKKLQLETLLDA
ncbi:MAG: hypothetical protein HYT82_02065 [Candidatus Harrisonbacteria bacterium]|nr:hypothetical protein [Candidatus Harrisonbacteria bacterium]